MPLSYEALTAAALVLACTYTVFGLTGFGSTLLAVPLLAQFIPIKFVVPMLLLLDFAAGSLLITRSARGVRMDELAWLFPFMLAGIAVGLTLLIRLPEPQLLATLGIFLLAYASLGLARRSTPVRLSRIWSAPIGLAAGGFGALFGAGGVLTAVYLGGRVEDKHELRATAASAVLLNSTSRVVLFALSGVLAQTGLLQSALVLLPAALLGLFLGHRLHAVVPAALVLRIVHIVVIVAGVSLLVRVIALH